jgi:hypothetical protein
VLRARRRSSYFKLARRSQEYPRKEKKKPELRREHDHTAQNDALSFVAGAAPPHHGEIAVEV